METIIKREIKKRGGVAKVAAELEVTTAAVYQWLNGARKPSSKLLSYLGLQRVERIIRAKEGSA